MPIPLLQLPMPTFQQANPWIQGAMAPQQLYQQAIQSKYAAPLAQSLLAQRQAQTGLTQEQAQAYPQESAARIAQEQAVTALQQAQTKLAPLRALTQAVQTSQTGTRFGPAYQLSRVLNNMDKPSRDQWIANNQEAYNNMVDSLGNAAIQQQTGGGMPTGIIGEALRQQFPALMRGMPQPQLTAPMQAVPAAATPQETALLRTPSAQLNPAQKEQKLQLAQQAVETTGQTGAMFGTTPQQVQQMQLQNQYNANRNSISPTLKAQQDFAIRSERFLKDNQQELSNRINNILEYAGARGRGERYFQMWANQNPEKLSDFDWYQNTFSVGLSNLLRQMEKMGATDQQQKSAMNMLDVINNITGNPTRARMTINKAVRFVGELADATNKAAEPINKGVTRQLYNLPKMTGDYIQAPTARGVAYSQEDLEYTARLHGISVDEVKRRLGGQ